MVVGSARSAPGGAKLHSEVLWHPRRLISQSESFNLKSGSEIVPIAPENAASIKGRCSRYRRFNASLSERSSARTVLAASASSRAIAESPYKASNTLTGCVAWETTRRYFSTTAIPNAIAERAAQAASPSVRSLSRGKVGVHESHGMRFAMSDSQGLASSADDRSIVLPMACIAIQYWASLASLSFKSFIFDSTMSYLMVSTRLPILDAHR